MLQTTGICRLEKPSLDVVWTMRFSNIIPIQAEHLSFANEIDEMYSRESMRSVERGICPIVKPTMTELLL